MTKFINILTQTFLGLGQITNLIYPILGEKQKGYVAVGLGVAQVVVSAVAHAYNPDGTPANVAYTKPEKLDKTVE